MKRKAIVIVSDARKACRGLYIYCKGLRIYHYCTTCCMFLSCLPDWFPIKTRCFYGILIFVVHNILGYGKCSEVLNEMTWIGLECYLRFEGSNIISIS